MPQLDLADPDGMGRVDTILVSVTPPDGTAIAAALRERGFAVLEAPTQFLSAGRLGIAPKVAIVDLDPPGAIDLVENAREAAPLTELLCVGDPDRAAELGLAPGDGRSFERPIDLGALVLSVVALAAPALDIQPLDETAGLDLTNTAALPPLDSDAPPLMMPPNTSKLLDLGSVLPSLEDLDHLGVGAIPEVSPELAQILEAAEQRVCHVVGAQGPSVPAPDLESVPPLPLDLLSVLDEPIDVEEPSSRAGGLLTGATTGPLRVDPSSAKMPSLVSLATVRPNRHGTPPPSPVPSPLFTTDPLDGTVPGGLGESGAALATAPRVLEAPVRLPAPPGVPEPPRSREPHQRSAELQRRIVDLPRPLLLPSREPPSHAPERSRSTAESIEPSQPARAVAAPTSGPAGSAVPLPAVLHEGEAVRALSMAIAGRVSGALALGPEGATRRIVLHDGDVVTAVSMSPDETLVAFLVARGDLDRGDASRLSDKLPTFGRHAGAALIAHGYLGQDDLWPVLRAHAEWVLGRAVTCEEGRCELSPEASGRLKAEPNVFGGATGAEVLLEAIRRSVSPEVARHRLGGPDARIADGPRKPLLTECALRPDEERVVRSAAGHTVGELLEGSEPELADVLYGLVALGVLEALAPSRVAEPAQRGADPLDEEAIRMRVRARVALVEDGDYFSLLGVSHTATAYEIRRAYLELRRSFEPARVLTAATADLAADVRLVLEVLDEAYEILREPHRRERYRKAIEIGPPSPFRA